MAQTVRNLPAMQGTQVGSLGWEDLLEKRMVTHSSILAWRIPWTEEPGGLQSMGSQEVRHNSMTNTRCSTQGALYKMSGGQEAERGGRAGGGGRGMGAVHRCSPNRGRGAGVWQPLPE